MESGKNSALKAGIWYIVCNIITNGMHLITTPIFTRILSQEDYGITVTYNSWLSILTIIATLDLYSCIQLSKIEYDNESDEFLSSILGLSSISVGIFYILFRLTLLIKPNWFGMPNILIEILFAEILFRNAYTLLQTKHRAYLKYKEFVITTIITAVAGQALSAFLVITMKQDQYLGRILGTAIPFFIAGLFIIIIVFYKGKTFFNRDYWTFGLKLSVPLIPHHLSGNILTQFDRIIINMCVGVSFSALYSLASNYALIVQVVWNSLNNAWIPWFYEQMKTKNITVIQRFVKPYTIFFSIIIIGAVALGPEAIMILGGEAYMDSLCVVPPIILGIYFQFLYSLYSNIEFYHKRTAKLALWTVIAAIANMILNYIFIPRYGYVAAAYTTLISYILLFALHYRTARKLEDQDIYNTKFLSAATLITIILVVIVYNLYSTIILRYGFIIALCGLSCVYIFKNRTLFFTMLKSKKK